MRAFLIKLILRILVVGAAVELLLAVRTHIGRPYNVNDHRLNTRSVHVSWFIKTFFWGLDDHVDHHLYPVVPSRNLPKLHRILAKDLPVPDNIFGCLGRDVRDLPGKGPGSEAGVHVHWIVMPPGTSESCDMGPGSVVVGQGPSRRAKVCERSLREEV